MDSNHRLEPCTRAFEMVEKGSTWECGFTTADKQCGSYHVATPTLRRGLGVGRNLEEWDVEELLISGVDNDHQWSQHRGGIRGEYAQIYTNTLELKGGRWRGTARLALELTRTVWIEIVMRLNFKKDIYEKDLQKGMLCIYIYRCVYIIQHAQPFYAAWLSS